MSINSSNQLWYKGHYLSCSFSIINPLCLMHATECHWNPVHPPGRQPALLREVLPATAAWYLGYTHKPLWEVDVRQREVVWEYVCVTCRLWLILSGCQGLQKTILLQCWNLDNYQTIDYPTFKQGHFSWSELLRKKFNYRQGSEWSAAVGVVFDIMSNYHSIHDLRGKTFIEAISE